MRHALVHTALALSSFIVVVGLIENPICLLWNAPLFLMSVYFTVDYWKNYEHPNN